MRGLILQLSRSAPVVAHLAAEMPITYGASLKRPLVRPKPTKRGQAKPGEVLSTDRKSASRTDVLGSRANL